MPQGKTYVKIASQTTGAVSSVTFSNIPQNFTDLVVVWNGTASALVGLNFEFNSDTTAGNYSFTRLYGDGTNVTSDRATSAQNWNGINTAQSMGIAHIQNYSNSSTFKTTLTRNQYQNIVLSVVGLWRSTNAINQIKLSAASGNISSGNTFTLYGIEAAKAPYATGGDTIVSDGTYWYHAFKYSGTFATSKALTADILVIAGGGGGGQYSGGGGGAGGLQAFTSQSLTGATGYAITVGGGGSAGSGSNGSSGTQGANSQFGALTASVGGGYGFGLNGTKGNGGNGGSGGGAGGVSGSSTGGTPTSGQGYKGGDSSGSYAGAGGGGAGAAAANATGNSTAGGAGLSSSLINAMASVTGTGQLSAGNYYFAGGGAGNAQGAAQTGGVGGGGATYAAGTASTGGGGGGDSGGGGSGGSGIVIVRYPI